MARFWMATFAAGSAITVIRKKGEYAVLFCTVDDVHQPTRLTCTVGFTNGLGSSAAGLGLGFPLADASVTMSKQGLEVRCPCFRSKDVIDYEAIVASIAGLTDLESTDFGGDPVDPPRDVAYEQLLIAPDPILPGTWVTQMMITWTASGILAHRLPARPLRIDVEDTRYPQLSGFDFGDVTPVAAWCGTFDLAKCLSEPKRGDQTRRKRADTFGVPSFRFEDVEVLGFRIDIANLDPVRQLSDLAPLCRPLNRHIDQGGGKTGTPSQSLPDYRYDPASRTLILELIRYGKMKITQPSQSLTVEDSQSQHELVLRMLVGRVDDDTGQAREPAVFVPAIFVDNTWSKILGRSLQGFDKYLADFCVSDGGQRLKLRPDGKLPPEGDLRPLSDISDILLSSTTGIAGTSKLLEVSTTPAADPGLDEFIPVNLDLAYTPLGPSRWRQSDFDLPEFRRAFAQTVVTSAQHGFRSIQASPIGPRLLRECLGSHPALISGMFKTLGGSRIVWPDGSAKISVSAPAGSPAGWKQFCSLVGAPQGGSCDPILLPQGSWYRMQCSLSFTVDDDG